MSAQPVAILGAGMMTGVGLTAEASCADFVVADRSPEKSQNRSPVSNGEF